MKKERLLIDGKISVGKLTIIPLVKLSIDYWQERNNYSFSVVKEPYALVFVDVKKTWVVDILGVSMELIDCIAKVPELARFLDELSIS